MWRISIRMMGKGGWGGGGGIGGGGDKGETMQCI